MYSFINTLVLLTSLIPVSKPIDLPRYNYEDFQRLQVFSLDEHAKVWLNGKRVKYEQVPEDAEILEVEFNATDKVIKTIKFRYEPKETKRGK
jgi:hypothetical protein